MNQQGNHQENDQARSDTASGAVSPTPASAQAGGGAAPGLGDLATLPLEASNQRVLNELAGQMVASSAVWRCRKLAEAHGLIALSQIAPRLRIRHLDLRSELIAVFEMHDTPVPCRAPGDSELHIENGALLTIEYPEEILTRPIAGTRPIRILEPRNIFHSNVGPYGSRTPSLCLGANVPRAFPLREMVLSSYAALTLQAISLDTMDPAGVLNGEAANWWQANRERIPLTTAPFLGLRAVGPPSARRDTEADTDGEGRS